MSYLIFFLSNKNSTPDPWYALISATRLMLLWSSCLLPLSFATGLHLTSKTNYMLLAYVSELAWFFILKPHSQLVVFLWQLGPSLSYAKISDAGHIIVSSSAPGPGNSSNNLRTGNYHSLFHLKCSFRYHSIMVNFTFLVLSKQNSNYL